MFIMKLIVEYHYWVYKIRHISAKVLKKMWNFPSSLLTFMGKLVLILYKNIDAQQPKSC